MASFFRSISEISIKKETEDDDEKPSKETKKKILEFWKWAVDKKNYVKTKLGTDYSSFLDRMLEVNTFVAKG